MESRKLLLVDDDPAVLNMLQKLIRSFGYEFDTAADGLQAMSKLEEDDYAIVLTDMMMPRMTGMELIRHIQQNHPHINTIAMTGYDRTFTYTDVIRAGANDFITKPFSADELEAKLSRIIRELELVRQLKELSISDALTQIYNRRYFDLKLLEETQRAYRQGHNAYLIIIDVYDLKGYNDQLGHQAGDILLQAVGSILTHCIRKNVDWAFRYGGDEFAVILSQVNLEQTRQTAERILEKFRDHNFSIAGLSIGIDRFIRHDNLPWEEDIQNVVSRADKAMYEAKRQGRNMIVVNCETEE